MTHWVGTISFLLLVFSGVEILMVHPRLYWGQVGNDLTPALFELPVSRNYHHGGWTGEGRTYDIFNQNGWGRSLHFLNAWILVATGLIYLFIALYTQHVRRNLLPGRREMSFRGVARDLLDHVRRRVDFVKGPRYGVLQKLSYCAVLFFLVPVTVLTGLTMSPAVTASNPWLLTLFFGAQSARTLHFFCAVLLILFLLVHVAMIVRSGFRKHLRAMTIES
jgi:thiosulfate reductase cytochrome b subunit